MMNKLLKTFIKNYTMSLWTFFAFLLMLVTPKATAENTTGVYYVTDYGALGDGLHDDTIAFQNAIDTATVNGGMVVVPLVGGGRGYVLKDTVYIKKGVALIGSLAGFTNNGWAAFNLPESFIVGPKIFARPSKLHRPLFQMEGGSTAKGLWILYDQQPMPSDMEFKDPKSPYYYQSFEQAKVNFVHDHVKVYGPTFYVPWANHVVIEDIMASQYYDFFFLKGGAKVTVNRVSLYGYNRAFVIQESHDVNIVSDVRYVPNVGPTTPGPVSPDKTYSWIYGIIVSQPSNVGLHIGASDGYIFNNLFFYGIHTAIRFGASESYPIHDWVDDTTWITSAAQGPWGQMSNVVIDQCTVGFHFVWPSHLSNRISNLQIFTAFDDGSDFNASTGTGSLMNVGKQAIFLFEPTFSKSNNISLIPTVMANNVMVASFQVPERFSLAAADAYKANGRTFLVAGDVTMEIFGFLIDRPYNEKLLIASAPTAEYVSIRIRGYVDTGNPGVDKEIDKNGLVMPYTSSVQLYTGWNMISFMSSKSMYVEEAMAPIWNEFVSVWQYISSKSTWSKYVKDGPSFLNDLAQMEPGGAYWVDVSQNCMWNYGNVLQAPNLTIRMPPFIIYGELKTDKQNLTLNEGDEISFKVGSVKASSYILGSNPLYRNHYVLEIPVDGSFNNGDVGKLYIDNVLADECPIELGNMGTIKQCDISLIPRVADLFQNYPNPFNPETWIPYQLSTDSDMLIRIYNASGIIIRTLNLGYKPAGFYTSKDKATYWDGRNEAGEEVSSGIYFYTIQAGDFTATKKMVITR